MLQKRFFLPLPAIIQAPSFYSTLPPISSPQVILILKYPWKHPVSAKNNPGIRVLKSVAVPRKHLL